MSLIHFCFGCQSPNSACLSLSSISFSFLTRICKEKKKKRRRRGRLTERSYIPCLGICLLPWQASGWKRRVVWHDRKRHTYKWHEETRYTRSDGDRDRGRQREMPVFSSERRKLASCFIGSLVLFCSMIFVTLSTFYGYASRSISTTQKFTLIHSITRNPDWDRKTNNV